MNLRTLWKERPRREWTFIVMSLGMVVTLLVTSATFLLTPERQWWARALHALGIVAWIQMGWFVATTTVRCARCGKAILVREHMVTDPVGRTAHLSCKGSNASR